MYTILKVRIVFRILYYILLVQIRILWYLIIIYNWVTPTRLLLLRLLNVFWYNYNIPSNNIHFITWSWYHFLYYIYLLLLLWSSMPAQMLETPYSSSYTRTDSSN